MPLYEGQILHMLIDMKEQMKDDQAQSDLLDCENAIREQKALR